MKKVTAALLSALILLSSFVCVYAKMGDNCDDWKDDEVIVYLTDNAFSKVKSGELVIDIDYFSDLDLGIVEILYGSGELYVLRLNEHSKNNVLRVVDELNKYEDIKIAYPNYISYKSCGEGIKYIKLKAGDESENIAPVEATIKSWKSSNKKVATVKCGCVTALKKGSAKITATSIDGTVYTCTVTVTDSPKIKINGKKFNKNTVYSVEKNKKLTVKITGKASSVKNSYKSSKKNVAKIISKKSAKTVKIKGLKKGRTTISLKINGVETFKLKVRVS